MQDYAFIEKHRSNTCDADVVFSCGSTDSVREMYKFREGSTSSFVQEQHDQELSRHMKGFRAQRNFYIAGFTLFLFV